MCIRDRESGGGRYIIRLKQKGFELLEFGLHNILLFYSIDILPQLGQWDSYRTYARCSFVAEPVRVGFHENISVFQGAPSHSTSYVQNCVRPVLENPSLFCVDRGVPTSGEACEGCLRS